MCHFVAKHSVFGFSSLFKREKILSLIAAYSVRSFRLAGGKTYLAPSPNAKLEFSPVHPLFLLLRYLTASDPCADVSLRY